jgi:very-short-patch-repair endonuclease
MGPFIADFLRRIERRLVVEIDGGRHAEGSSDADVVKYQDGGLESIEQALALTPALSRKRERE